MTITRQADNYKMGMGALGVTLGQSSWTKGQLSLNLDANGGTTADVFRGEEDEDDLYSGDGQTGSGAHQGASIGNQMINKESIMSNVQARIASINPASADSNAASSENTVAQVPAGSEANTGLSLQTEQSIKDIVEERQEQLKDLEQL